MPAHECNRCLSSFPDVVVPRRATLCLDSASAQTLSAYLLALSVAVARANMHARTECPSLPGPHRQRRAVLQGPRQDRRQQSCSRSRGQIRRRASPHSRCVTSMCDVAEVIVSHHILRCQRSLVGTCLAPYQSRSIDGRHSSRRRKRDRSSQDEPRRVALVCSCLSAKESARLSLAYGWFIGSSRTRSCHTR